ncbi:MAG: radical SAM protein [Candidatus Omnitrophica bacterium]|nr:radical SAM protein [Candidatus Omnitrophota bacterium]
MIYPGAEAAVRRLVGRAEEKRIPLWVHIDLTHRCNLSCIHCYCRELSDGFLAGKTEMTLAEIRRVIDQLAESGALYLTLSGGEILAYPHFFEVAEHAKRKNFCLTLFTNGTLVDEAIARRMKGLMPKSVEMSIYGSTAKVHDAITGKKGSFERLTAAVGILKREGLRVVLKSVIMEPNFHQAEEIPGFARRLGADDYDFTIEVCPKNDGTKTPQQYQLSEKHIYEFMSMIITDEMAREKPFSGDPLQKAVCGTGLTTCYITPYGDVHPCPQLFIPMGNVKKRHFKEIWENTTTLMEELRSIKTYGDFESCPACRYVGVCRKCIGMAYLETNDIRKCYKTLETMSRIEYEIVSKRGGGA